MPQITTNLPKPIIFSTEQIRIFKKGAISGLVSMSLRRVFAQIIQTSTNIILARILFPRDFGIFAIVLLFVSLFTLLADLGLSAAIVQSPKPPTKHQLRAIFTTQLLLAVVATLLMWLMSPLLFHFYKGELGDKGVFYLQLSSFAIILHNLKLIPNSLLERSLRFKKLAIAEIIELAIGPIVTVALVLAHFGVVSFIIGLLMARLVSTLTYHWLSPWPVGLAFSKTALKSFLPFGLPFQINQTIGTLSGSIGPVVVGTLAGASALGLLNWAGGVGTIPQTIGEIIGRIMFPLNSRVQHDLKLFQKSLERSIQFASMVALPMVAMLIALAQPITYIIFTDKWAPAIPALYLFAIQSYLMVLNSILTSALFALGYSKTVRNINFFMVASQWLLTIPLVMAYGITGYAIASLIISTAFLISLRELKKIIDIKILKYNLMYLIYSSISGAFIFIYTWRYPVKSLLELIIAATLGFSVYLLFMMTFERKLIMSYITNLAELHKK